MTAAGTSIPMPAFWRRNAQLWALLVSGTGVLLAFVVGGLRVLIAGGHPVEAFRSMFSGSLGSSFSIGQLLVTMTPLLIIGLGLGLAFRGR